MVVCWVVICVVFWLDLVDDNCLELFWVEVVKVINGFVKIVDKNLDNYGFIVNLKKW